MLSKIEVIFKILEVNFGILLEVICPASKSQGWSLKVLILDITAYLIRECDYW